jgi:hypothetical protein
VDAGAFFMALQPFSLGEVVMTLKHSIAVPEWQKNGIVIVLSW